MGRVGRVGREGGKMAAGGWVRGQGDETKRLWEGRVHELVSISSRPCSFVHLLFNHLFISFRLIS